MTGAIKISGIETSRSISFDLTKLLFTADLLRTATSGKDVTAGCKQMLGNHSLEVLDATQGDHVVDLEELEEEGSHGGNDVPSF
jgi:hypothetical protein